MTSYALTAANVLRNDSTTCLASSGKGEASDGLSYSLRKKSAIGGDASRIEEIETFGRRCREGEWAAWDLLFSVAWPVLVSFVHRLYNSFDRQDAEDVAQAAMEAAIRNIGTYSGKGLFRGWLFGIAANQATILHRKKSAQKRGADLLVPLVSATDCGAELKSPAEVSAENDRAGILHRAIDELSETDRDLIHLHFFGELTFKEIAEARKMNAKTVCTRLTKCKAKLSVILTRSKFTYADG